MIPIDEPAPVRPGEGLDVVRLETYLRAHLPGPAGPLEVEQFPHGYSNLTYLLRLGGRELVLRRPPVGNAVKSAHDMGREFRVLQALAPTYPPAPRPLLCCDDESVLGAPFYLMERRRGVILRHAPPPGLAPDTATVRRLGEVLIDHLAGLHAIDYRAAGLADLGRPEGYVQRQVTGWTRRYRDAQTADLPALERVADWLAQHQPADGPPVLIHNDYKFDNLVLDPDDLARVVAVLDWEMATVGDPLMDLGTTLGYWVQADDPDTLKPLVVGPTTLPGAPSRRDLAERYLRVANRAPTDLLFYYAFGLFKIAVIAQQIYARFVRGHTRDPRFARLDLVVTALGEAADRAITSGRF